MPTYVNYTSLFSDIQAYLERGGATSDPVVFAQIPRLINAAERKIMQTLKLQGTIEVLRDPVGLPQGNFTIAKPDRWRETISLSYGAGANNNAIAPLYPRSLEFCQQYWPDSSVQDTAQPPLFYADLDYSNIYIVPTAPAAYPTQGVFYMQPQLLDSGNQSNFFTQYTPNLLLYGALLEAAPFLKGDERIATWQGLWDRDAATLVGMDLQKILDRTANRVRP